MSDLVLILPLAYLSPLHFSKRQLLSLMSIFLLGFVVICLSVVRTISLATTGSTTHIALLSTFECSFGIIVACAPELRILVHNNAGSDSIGKDLENGEVCDPSEMNDDLNQREPTPTRNSTFERLGRPRPISGNFEFVRGWSGRYIFKHVDFEIRSSIESENSRTRKQVQRRRTEEWEMLP